MWIEINDVCFVCFVYSVMCSSFIRFKLENTWHLAIHTTTSLLTYTSSVFTFPFLILSILITLHIPRCYLVFIPLSWCLFSLNVPLSWSYCSLHYYSYTLFSIQLPHLFQSQTSDITHLQIMKRFTSVTHSHFDILSWTSIPTEKKKHPTLQWPHNLHDLTNSFNMNLWRNLFPYHNRDFIALHAYYPLHSLA